MPVCSSKTRSFLRTLCVGSFSRAASRRSCAFSDFLSSFCIRFVGGTASSETGFAEEVSAAWERTASASTISTAEVLRSLCVTTVSAITVPV